eukprot:3299888-Prymnesium_polylepis.1
MTPRGNAGPPPRGPSDTPTSIHHRRCSTPSTRSPGNVPKAPRRPGCWPTVVPGRRSSRRSFPTAPTRRAVSSAGRPSLRSSGPFPTFATASD